MVSKLDVLHTTTKSACRSSGARPGSELQPQPRAHPQPLLPNTPPPLPPCMRNQEQPKASLKAEPKWQFPSEDTTQDTHLGQRGAAMCVSASSCARFCLLQ